MEWKDIIRKGAEFAKEATEKFQDSQTQEKVAKKVAETLADASQIASSAASNAAQAATDMFQKTKEYVEENRMIPGAKEQYIQELETELAKKNREIARLKKKLGKRTWKR